MTVLLVAFFLGPPAADVIWELPRNRLQGWAKDYDDNTCGETQLSEDHTTVSLT